MLFLRLECRSFICHEATHFFPNFTRNTQVITAYPQNQFYLYHQMVSSHFFIRWPRLILVCWALAILPSIPLMFNSTIETDWESKSNCKCFVPLDDVSISDLHHLLISQDIMFCYATNLHNSGCPTYYRWILGLIFLIFFPENLLVLDVPHNVLDSDFIHLLHLVDHGTPLYCGFRQVYKQQVGIR